MKKIAFITFLVIFQSIILFAAENKQPTETVPEDLDIHYTGQYCSECHETTPSIGGATNLKHNGDFSKLCRCHGYSPGTYIHPVDIFPSEEKISKIPNTFPLKDGKLSCTTCHDIYLQCQDKPRYKIMNKRFLRGAPYASRTTLCFNCHDERKYTMLDPHNQLTKEGEIVIEKCLYCHVEKPDEKNATFKQVKLIGKLKVLCFRCHFKQSNLHPINANHLRKPSPEILAMMKDSERKYGIILPLDNGIITCPTCHNPHERGVIPGEKAGAQGASEKYRLRLAGKGLKICVACHKDKFQ